MLGLAAKHGRLILVLGLLAGAGLPALASDLAPWVGEMIAALLFLNALRVGVRGAFGGLTDMRRALAMVLGLQLALPVLLLGAVWLAGLSEMSMALTVVLMLSAPSLTGGPNFVAMTGQDPGPAMRLLVIGTALFPLTAFVVLFLLPSVSASEALWTTIQLALVILCVVGLGFAARKVFVPDDVAHGFERQVDGASAVLLGVVVVGLMSEVGPLLRSDPAQLAQWVGVALALNFGLQVGGLLVFRWLGIQEAVAGSVVAGNRNIALFLIALPEEIMAPALLFIGCYQVPMYLTPLLLRRLHGAQR